MPPARTVYRYISGRPLNGRPDHPYFKPGAGRWPGWKRQILRVAGPAAMVGALMEPTYAEAGAPVVAVAVLHSARRRWARRRFRRAYVAPTLAAIRPNLGINDVRLFVDPTLGTLTPRLAKPLSPAEVALRTWYGIRIEPVVRWPGEQIMRGLWAAQKRAAPVTSRIATQVRRPGEKPGPRIELTVETPYLTADQRTLISAIITSKIPVSDLIEVWHQVGPRVSATWTVRRRPPTRVGYEEVMAALPALAEWEFYLGAGPGNRPVVLSLQDDSPHMAISAGSGAGKSVFAMLVAVQVLARGGRVVILDRKGSHRWALGLAGVDYCTKPAQMHDALIKLAELADERNTLALHEEEDWNPGERVLVICEELNATIGQLVNYWAVTREKGEPKKSPAVSAIADILFMGRSAKVNMLAIAQMLTARAIGGPEARENFGIRCLARYTTNAWKMLVPEAAMPRTSRTLGRWQIVVGGVATETQVAFLPGAQARSIACPVPEDAKVPDDGLTSNVPGDRDMLTLREACDAGVLPWTYDAAKKRLQRRVGQVPKPRGQRGTADLYARSDLVDWVG